MWEGKGIFVREGHGREVAPGALAWKASTRRPCGLAVEHRKLLRRCCKLLHGLAKARRKLSKLPEVGLALGADSHGMPGVAKLCQVLYFLWGLGGLLPPRHIRGDGHALADPPGHAKTQENDQQYWAAAVRNNAAKQVPVARMNGDTGM